MGSVDQSDTSFTSNSEQFADRMRIRQHPLEYEDIVLPSMDGIPLEARFIPADSDKVVIAVHPRWLTR